MTLSDRETGELLERLRQVEHRARNDRTIIKSIEEELDEVRTDLDQLRTRIYVTIGCFGIVVSVAAWTVEVLRR